MTYHARFTEQGLLAVPGDLAREIGFKPGDLLTIERQGDALLVMREDAPSDALGRLRHALRGYSVDQFLAERRTDWRE